MNQKPLDRAEELLDIADWIKEVAKRFDTKSDPCKCCGIEKHHNRDEYLAHTQLVAMAEKAEKIASKLRKNGGGVDIDSIPTLEGD